MTELEKAIGYEFKKSELLTTALTHTSFANESKKAMRHNERLEFLGDSVLGMVVGEYLYTSEKNISEGDLTRKRALLVCEQALSGFARAIHLGDYLLLGHGEVLGGGRERASILSDAFEALIAALYLDGGLEIARTFILPFIQYLPAQSEDDYKTRLQEVVQQNPEERLRYALIAETGPDHDKHFVIEVHLNSNCIGSGEGKSKKAAEQQAARQALVLMGLEKNNFNFLSKLFRNVLVCKCKTCRKRRLQQDDSSTSRRSVHVLESTGDTGL